MPTYVDKSGNSPPSGPFNNSGGLQVIAINDNGESVPLLVDVNGRLLTDAGSSASVITPPKRFSFSVSGTDTAQTLTVTDIGAYHYGEITITTSAALTAGVEIVPLLWTGEPGQPLYAYSRTPGIVAQGGVVAVPTLVTLAAATTPGGTGTVYTYKFSDLLTRIDANHLRITLQPAATGDNIQIVGELRA